MAARVALDHQPLAASHDMLPVFPMWSRLIVADEDVSVPGLEIRIVICRARHRRIAAVTEFVVVARLSPVLVKPCFRIRKTPARL